MKLSRNYIRYTKSNLLGRFIKHRNKKIVFVIGSGRCGSTVLVKILDSNPNLHIIPGEFNEIFHKGLYLYKEEYKKITPPIVEDIKTFTGVSMQTWNKKEVILRNIISAENYFSENNLVVIKSAMISLMVSQIASSFPKSVFINLYRNGIPVVNSIVKKEAKKYEGIGISQDKLAIDAAGYWSSCVTHIHEKSEKINDRVFNLSYEDLVAAPKVKSEELAKWLEVPSTYEFDFSTIENRNKDEKLAFDFCHDEVINALEPGMKILGYD